MVDIKKLEPIGGTISVVNVPVAMLTASNMPMRDCMAMAAMQGLIQRGFTEFGNRESAYANLAYVYADTMLRAREQK